MLKKYIIKLSFYFTINIKKNQLKAKKTFFYAASFILALFFFANITRAVSGLSIWPKPIQQTSANINSKPSWIYLNVPPGNTITGKVIAKNLGANGVYVWVHPADSTLTKGGNFALKPNDAVMQTIGKWTRISPSNFYLGPNESFEVSYSVTVPETINPGEYSGGIIIENDSNFGSNIGFSSRVGVRVYLSVKYQEISKIISVNKQTYNEIVKIPDDGKVNLPIELKQNNDSATSLFIPKGTSLVTESGAPYSGTIAPPIDLPSSNLPGTLPSEMNFRSAIDIETGSRVIFNRNITITMPLPAGIDKSKIHVYYFDNDTNSYKTAGDGGTVSADGNTVIVNVNHLTIFVALEEILNTQENSSGGNNGGGSAGGSGGGGGGGGGGGFVTSTSKPETSKSEITKKLKNSACDKVPFLDISKHWAYPYVKNLYCRTIVKGRSKNKFEPDSPLTRAEMVKIALLNFGYEVKDHKSSFNDISENSWYRNYIATGETLAIINGYKGNLFKPDQPVTRAEALKILILSAKLKIEDFPAAPFKDVPSYAWYYKYINLAYKLKIIDGKSPTKFAPDEKITRGEMSKIADKMKLNLKV